MIRHIRYLSVAVALFILCAGQNATADWRAVGKLSDHLPLVDASCDLRLRVPGAGPAPSELVLPLSRAVSYTRADGAVSSQVLSFGVGLGELLQFRTQGAFATSLDFSDYFANKGAFDARVLVNLFEPTYPSWQNSSAVALYYSNPGSAGRVLAQTTQSFRDGFRALVTLETRCFN